MLIHCFTYKREAINLFKEKDGSTEMIELREDVKGLKSADIEPIDRVKAEKLIQHYNSIGTCKTDVKCISKYLKSNHLESDICIIYLKLENYIKEKRLIGQVSFGNNFENLYNELRK
jgi:hypothetical protein